MTVPGAGRKVTGAGFALIGLIVWAAAAVGPLVAHPEVAFLGVPLGGMLTMGGLALSFTSGCRIAARYFEETEEVARAPRRSRRPAGIPPAEPATRKGRSPPDGVAGQNGGGHFAVVKVSQGGPPTARSLRQIARTVRLIASRARSASERACEVLGRP